MSTRYAVNSDTLEEDLVYSLAEFSLPECIQWTHNSEEVEATPHPRPLALFDLSWRWL